MAPHPTAAPARAATPRRATVAARRPAGRSAVAAGAAALILVAGCDTLSMRRLDFDTTETATVARVVLRPGAGDVTVRGTGPTGQIRVKRVLRYHGEQPDTRYELNGDELVLDTDCGPRCSVSYDVTVPPGTAVRGEGGSGNIDLTQVGAVELRLGSGNVDVSGATGAVRAETGSGDVEVTDVSGPATLRAGSGNITGRGLGGQVDAETGSGNVDVELSVPASARAHAASGDVDLVVPAGRYRVRSNVGSGDADLGITDDPTASLLVDVSVGSGNVTVSAR
ncbi:DUF4097 domain-containing protein [Micromonospora sp. NBC_01655]|uniref:DUF4097 family beta strand repeat-containing protein n=1 Tax=Micromonospora sp. NBC_01655 TaxID=2975983 RepID=UPI002251D8D6|nr:DUF4097 family beta strand repeat-containing protein [Micromonospora sp. NBC_01655]MCX4470628.1 DUF4097 domain-containing protein [Micromonospora sp. NBC_01655]